jgi:hypothetical protein
MFNPEKAYKKGKNKTSDWIIMDNISIVLLNVKPKE